jgi:hypothetical protein
VDAVNGSKDKTGPKGMRLKQGLCTHGLSDDRFLLSTVCATALTIFIYAILLPFFADSFLADLLGNHGWVPCVIVFLSLWAIAQLGIRWLALQRQSRCIGANFLSSTGDGPITPELAHAYAQKVRESSKSYPQNIIADLVVQALERFHVCRNPRQVAEYLQQKSEAAANSVESGYRVILAVAATMPILVIIATASGIAWSVGEIPHFLKTASNFAILLEGLSKVIAGLKEAFSITMFGLTMSLVITLPTVFLQRSEEKFLIYVEDYCKTHLLPRLESEPVNSRAEQEEAIRRAITTEMAKHQLEFQSWTQRLEATGEKILSPVSTGMEKLCNDLNERAKALAETLADQETARYRATCRSLESLQATAETRFKASFEALQRNALALQDTLASKTEGLLKSLESVSAKVLDVAERQRDMLTADRELLTKTMKQHEEVSARMQAQAENTHAAVLQRLEGFLTASGRGIEVIGEQLNRMAATHEGRMLEISKSFAAGMDQAVEKGRRVQEQFTAEMDVLHKNGTRMASAVGDLNRSLALCASMLEQVQNGLSELAAATEARKKLRLGYGRRIARFFGIQEGVKS